MPFVFLANVLRAIVGGLVAFFTSGRGSDLLFRLLLVALYIAAWAAFSAAVSGLLSLIQSTAPTSWYAFGISLLPGNTGACVAALAGTKFARWVLLQNISIGKIKAGA